MIRMPCGHPTPMGYSYAYHLRFNIIAKEQITLACSDMEQDRTGAWLCNERHTLKQIIKYNEK